MIDDGGFKISDRRTSLKEPDEDSRSKPQDIDFGEMKSGLTGNLNESPDQAMEMDEGLPLLALPAEELAGFFISTLFQKAFISIGMPGAPEGERTAPNFPEAKLAINLAAVLIKQMTGKWGDPGLEKELDTQLAGLKLAYARMAPAGG
jgi:hypothetical protein